MLSIVTYAAAALAEIAGCFAFWAWLRLNKSPLWLAPGVLSLMLFAYLLTRVDSAAAGRAYAAYGGVNRRPKRTPYRRAKGTPFVEQRDGYDGRFVRAGCGVGRA